MKWRPVIIGLALALIASAGRAEEVKIDNFTFTPPVLTVHVGEKVEWENRDDIPHTVTEANRGEFISEALDTGDKFTFTFTKAGEFSYFCSLHPHMQGKVIVVE